MPFSNFHNSPITLYFMKFILITPTKQIKIQSETKKYPNKGNAKHDKCSTSKLTEVAKSKI